MSLYREKSEHWRQKTKHWQRHWKATCVTLEVRTGSFSTIKKSLGLEQSNMKCNQTQLKNVCLFIQGQLGITVKGTCNNKKPGGAWSWRKGGNYFWVKKRQPSWKRCPYWVTPSNGFKSCALVQRRRWTVLYILMKEDGAVLPALL